MRLMAEYLSIPISLSSHSYALLLPTDHKLPQSICVEIILRAHEELHLSNHFLAIPEMGSSFEGRGISCWVQGRVNIRDGGIGL